MGSRRGATLLAAIVLASILLPATALAHATMLRSDPPDGCALLGISRVPANDPRCAAGAVLATPPQSIHLWFSEPVKPFGGGITVIAPSGRRAEHGPVQAGNTELSIGLDAQEEGTYRVRWQVISNDTHPARGGFGFSVGHPSGSFATTGPERGDIGAVSRLGLGLQVASRWLHFAGFALGFGPLAFLFLILRPISTQMDERVRSHIWRLVNAGILALLVAGALSLLAQTSSLEPSEILDPDAAIDALASSFGRILSLQIGAALLLWMLLAVISAGSGIATAAALFVGLLLAFVDGYSTHATSGGPAWLGLPVSAVHLAAMALWFGGLATLLYVWNLAGLEDRRGDALRRFARLAALSLVLLAGSGTIMGWVHLTGPADLFTVGYGRALFAKTIMVVVALTLAWVGGQAAERKRWWALEIGCLSGVLVLAGLLVSLPPPR